MFIFSIVFRDLQCQRICDISRLPKKSAVKGIRSHFGSSACAAAMATTFDVDEILELLDEKERTNLKSDEFKAEAAKHFDTADVSQTGDLSEAARRLHRSASRFFVPIPAFCRRQI